MENTSSDGTPGSVPAPQTGRRVDRLVCLLLGEEPLLLHCAEVLVERGHELVGIVTRTPSIAAWASQHGVPVLGRDEYPVVVERQPPDVLLSITHPALIRPEVIARARLAAINYHDGPLPRYAGINGSAWALHNGERQHAVVWHHLTAGLDDGDILERRDLAIDARETSVSLNIKNAAAALASFRDIVARLETRQLLGTPQTRGCERSVYSRHDRPAAMCIIDWTAPKAAVDRLVRSCDFGLYPNRFGMAKIVHGGNAVLVRESTPVEGARQPGEVLAAEPDSLTVACADGALQLRGFATPTGRALSAREAAARLGLRPGDVLTCADLPLARTWSRAFAENEPFCVAALGDRKVPQLPFERRAGTAEVARPVAVPAALLARLGPDPTAALMAAFAFTLSVVLREDDFDIGLLVPAVLPPALASLACRMLPWRIAVDGGAPFSTLVGQLDRQRADRARRPGFLLDLIARHPLLREQPDLQRGEVSTVAVLAPGDALPAGVELALRLGDGSAELVSSSLDIATLDAFASWMGRVLTSVTDEPARALATVDLLEREQRARQLSGWNATARPFPDALRIHDLFDLQATTRPDAVALVFEQATMSFREVEAAANRVANALQARGIGAGQYVGLLAERDFSLVVAMIGIAKSGAAYVPLDPAYPPERCQFMLEDAGCVAVVASASLRERCRGLPVLSLDGDEVRQAPSLRPRSTAAATDVCYAIFTSGSTGKPKAVALTHRAVVNTLDWVNRELGVGASDRLLFVTSPSFDLSVYDVFGALGAGASVDIAAAQRLADPHALLARLSDGGITIWDSAPPALARLASFFPPSLPAARLRLVMLSGDYIPVGLPPQLRRVFPGVRVESLGGATEAAIWSNHYHVEHVDPAWTSIPYGYPIQNCRYYILDHHRRPLPAGITGDLYIGGTCLAQGYLARPELTQERFLPDPFLPGERIYKTGDLARYWPDGTMEFRGRADAQVKVRGFRVELGEVEAALVALPSVRQAVCVARADASGQKSLVAYVVPAEGGGFDARAARAALAVALPEFMVPSFVIALAAFPLTANGKLDRKALPAPEAYADGKPHRPARTPTERALVAIWQELLRRQRIGIDESFFDLGGHSMLVVLLVQALKQRLGVEVPLSRVLECSTIERLAASLEVDPIAALSPSVNELKPGGPDRFFFIHDGEGETLLYRSLAQHLPARFGVYGILPRCLPGVPLAQPSVEDMATFSLAEMKKVQPQGPYHLGGLCAGAVIAFEMAVQLERQGESAALVVMLEGFHPRARMRQGLAARQRLRALLVDGDASALTPGAVPGLVWRAVGRTAAKLRHVARYQAASSLAHASVRARLLLLRQVLTRGWQWPAWIVPLRARDIYAWAAARYRPSVLGRARVVLVKATAAAPGVEGDQPGRALYEDPVFGWAPHVASRLDVIDAAGGHSTMLREPCVAKLADQLNPVLEQACPRLPEPRPATRPAPGSQRLDPVDAKHLVLDHSLSAREK